MDIEQYEAVRDLILDMLNDADQDTLLLKDVVAGLRTVSAATSSSQKGRLTIDYVCNTKTDMEARCEIERIPRSSRQRITLWRPDPI